jgi:serine/threonine-protein kinase HipA
MPEIKILDVYRGNELIGQLFNDTPLKFIYSDSCLKQGGEDISPNIGLSKAEHTGPPVEAYFENLLPEAGIRELLKMKYHVSSVFGLLNAIGGDTASNLTLLPHGELPKASQYRDVTWAEIEESIRNPNERTYNTQANEGVRISLAGAQKKMTILIKPDGSPAQPMDSSPSTHILKPDIMGLEGVWSSAINETFVMKLANSQGIGVAEVEYQPIVSACLIKRYDRIVEKDGAIRKLHQLDLCQLEGKPSTIKYESDGGPSLAKCRHLLINNGVTAADLKRLLQWVFFNLFVGNNDSHAKNLSIYFVPDEGAKLTPFYDLLSTSLYPGLSRKFAFKIGGENEPSNITSEHIKKMADELKFKPKYVMEIAENISIGILNNVEGITSELNQVANVGTEQTMLERLNDQITSNTKKFQKRLF